MREEYEDGEVAEVREPWNNKWVVCVILGKLPCCGRYYVITADVTIEDEECAIHAIVLDLALRKRRGGGPPPDNEPDDHIPPGIRKMFDIKPKETA